MWIPVIRRLAASLVAFLLLAAAPAARALLKEAPGAQDHPLVSRYAGSLLIGYRQDRLDDSEVPLGPAVWRDGKPGLERQQTVAGKRTRLLYLASPDRSALEVVKSYEESLTRAGFATLFSCARETCGKRIAEALYSSPDSPRKLRGQPLTEYAFSMNVQDERLLTARLSRTGGDVYVTVFAARQDNTADKEASGRVAIFVEVVEAAMERSLVTVDAGTIQKAFGAEGRVALYGLYFDPGKADLKPESRPQLEEMARLLRANPQLKIFVVGHTDNQGSFEHNLDLSQHRAEAVVRVLAASYGVDFRRMMASGVANLVPAASNASEAGRAKNRRVELVEQ